MLDFHDDAVDMALDASEASHKLFRTTRQYDLIILDLDLPRTEGWNMLKRIRETPETADLPVMILTGQDTEDILVQGLHRGADMVLVKPVTPQRMLAHIEALTRRRSKVTPEARLDGADLEARHLPGLTPRENEILKLIIRGWPNQRIARHLVISEITVKNHLGHIFRKLGVTNRTQAAYLASQIKAE